MSVHNLSIYTTLQSSHNQIFTIFGLFIPEDGQKSSDYINGDFRQFLT